MIPVGVRDQEWNVLIASAFSDDVLSRQSDSCAGVHQDIVVSISDFHTGGVASIADRVSSRAGNGASISPEMNFHSYPLDEIVRLGQFHGQNFFNQEFNTLPAKSQVLVDGVVDGMGYPVAAEPDSSGLDVMRCDGQYVGALNGGLFRDDVVEDSICNIFGQLPASHHAQSDVTMVAAKDLHFLRFCGGVLFFCESDDPVVFMVGVAVGVQRVILDDPMSLVDGAVGDGAAHDWLDAKGLAAMLAKGIANETAA